MILKILLIHIKQWRKLIIIKNIQIPGDNGYIEWNNEEEYYEITCKKKGIKQNLKRIIELEHYISTLINYCNKNQIDISPQKINDFIESKKLMNKFMEDIKK
jgi:hypothetical protein